MSKEAAMSTVGALVIAAGLIDTSVDIFTGVINNATMAERASVKSVSDLIQLYFMAGLRMHRQINEEIIADGFEPPAVDLSDFAGTLREYFHPLQQESFYAPKGSPLH